MGLCSKCVRRYRNLSCLTYLDLSIDCALLIVKLIIVIWEHLEVVECKFFPDSLFENAALLESE